MVLAEPPCDPITWVADSECGAAQDSSPVGAGDAGTPVGELSQANPTAQGDQRDHETTHGPHDLRTPSFGSSSNASRLAISTFAPSRSNVARALRATSFAATAWPPRAST